MRRVGNYGGLIGKKGRRERTVAFVEKGEVEEINWPGIEY